MRLVQHGKRRRKRPWEHSPTASTVPVVNRLTGVYIPGRREAAPNRSWSGFSCASYGEVLPVEIWTVPASQPDRGIPRRCHDAESTSWWMGVRESVGTVTPPWSVFGPHDCGPGSDTNPGASPAGERRLSGIEIQGQPVFSGHSEISPLGKESLPGCRNAACAAAHPGPGSPTPFGARGGAPNGVRSQQHCLRRRRSSRAPPAGPHCFPPRR